MSYPQVATIVVNMNLRSAFDKESEGLCSQSNPPENESNLDESNLATSAKKKRPGASQCDDNETPARRRSR